MISLIFAAMTSVGGPPFFTPPAGWDFYPPDDQMTQMGIVALWQPAKRNGESITLNLNAREGSESLDNVQAKVIREETNDGRTVLGVRNHPTCNGRRAGRDISMRFGPLVSQMYHVTVKGSRVYTLLYTYAPNAKPRAAVMKSFDSFCPP